MQESELLPDGCLVESDVVRHTPEVTVPFWYLVVQDKSVSPDSRDQLCDKAVVLMCIVGPRSEHEVCTAGPRHVLESLLHLIPSPGEPSIGKVVQMIGDVRAGQEVVCRGACLFVAMFRTSHQHVVDGQLTRCREAQKSPSTPDLNVVRVRAEANDGEGAVGKAYVDHETNRGS